MNAVESIHRLRPWLIAAVVALIAALGIAPLGRESTVWGWFVSDAAAAPLGCLPGEPSTMVWPTLTQVNPINAQPGQDLVVSGNGGYIRCGNNGYDESARSFALTFDDAAIGEIGCYVNYCQTTITIPSSTTPGTHTIATEGGSQITIQVQGAMATQPDLFFPSLMNNVTDVKVPGNPQHGCPPGETGTLVFPTLQHLTPSSAAPGATVQVVGSGGYIRCSGGGYNESARSFDLFFDGAVIGQIGCYVNRCQTTLTVPHATTPGAHVVSVDGGSQLTLTVQ